MTIKKTKRAKSKSKKDELLKQIFLRKEVSSEAIIVMGGDYYVEKLRTKLMAEGLLKKSLLKNSKKTARKAGVYFKTQSYYVTAKGKKYLLEKFPDEFSEEILETRKQSNDATERLVKISDSAVMSETAGAFVADADTSAAAIKENIHRGVFFPASEAKKNLTLTKKEVNQYKFTAITGSLLTTAKPYCLYHAGNGFLSQTSAGEEKIASSLTIAYAKNYGLYHDEILNLRITNAIIFCKNIGAFAKLILNKYNSKIAPGAIFENSYIIPVSRSGCNIIKRFIEEPEYKNKLINHLISEYGFIKRTGYASASLPIEGQNGEAIFIGIDFDVNNLRTAIDVIVNDDEAKYQKMVIYCYEWQQDYYEEVIKLLDTDKITCQPLDENALDEVIGFKNRIPTIKNKRRTLQ